MAWQRPEEMRYVVVLNLWKELIFLARKPVRNGREKAEWEKRFYSTVKTEMDVFDLDNKELGKVLGVCEDTFSLKLNDPCCFDLFEFCKMCDFLHIDRAELINKVCPKGFKR